MIVLAEALKKASRPTSSEIWKGMRQIQSFPGVTGIVQFDEKGDVQKYPRIYTVSDGRLVDYDKYVEGKRREILERLQRLNREAERTRRGAAQGGT